MKGGDVMNDATLRWMIKWSMLALTLVVLTMVATN